MSSQLNQLKTNSIPWTQKYLPKKTKDVFGQDKAIGELLDYIKSYKTQKKKSCMVYGAVGSGKTSAIHSIANELDLELMEMNASDFRNKEGIQSMVGTASVQRSLFFKSKILLIDEVDGLSGTQDRGGIQAIKEVIEKSAFPVICTVNDPYEDKLSSLRKISVMIEFATLDYRSIANKLKTILDTENCSYDEEALKSLARKVGGDMRGAITDLQTITASGKKKLDSDSVREFENNDRKRTESMANALLKVFKSTDIKVAKDAYENVDEDTDGISLWLEENLPKEYHGEDLKNALMWMSKADVYKGRIRRWQHWRFMVYIYVFYSAGIAISKKEKYKEFVKYSPTTKLLKIWINNAKYGKRKAIAEKISGKLHNSIKGTIKETIPYIRIMCSKDKQFQDNFKREYEIEDEEMEWIIK